MNDIPHGSAGIVYGDAILPRIHWTIHGPNAVRHADFTEVQISFQLLLKFVSGGEE